jgi:hypothetical protein
MSASIAYKITIALTVDQLAFSTEYTMLTLFDLTYHHYSNQHTV